MFEGGTYVCKAVNQSRVCCDEWWHVHLLHSYHRPLGAVHIHLLRVSMDQRRERPLVRSNLALLHPAKCQNRTIVVHVLRMNIDQRVKNDVVCTNPRREHRIKHLLCLFFFLCVCVDNEQEI